MNKTTTWLSWGAAILFFAAGIVHFAVVPHHWEHAPAHGIFMAVAGVVEVIWAIAFRLKPNQRLAQLGLVIAIGFLTLWGITRVFPAPFGHGPEEFAAPGLSSKFMEALAALALVAWIGRTSQSLPRPGRAWRSLAAVIVVSIILGFGAYEAARAAEPLFPGLAPAEIHEEEEHPHAPEEAPHDHAFRDVFA